MGDRMRELDVGSSDRGSRDGRFVRGSAGLKGGGEGLRRRFGWFGLWADERSGEVGWFLEGGTGEEGEVGWASGEGREVGIEGVGGRESVCNE